MATQYIPSRHKQVEALLDRALTCYSDWREREDAVADAYGQWSAALDSSEEALRFCTYIAALDQEAAAAAVYADSIRELDRLIQRA
jgi:hypothetical protein